MTKAKNAKRALLMSVLSMLLCVSMLVGSTFAWFTDSVTSGNNRIVAGNLDVELYYNNASTKGEWKDASKESVTNPNFFVDKDGKDILWEPGVMAYTYFKVTNEGSLALKYKLTAIVDGCNKLNGRDLSEVIKFAVIEGKADLSGGRDSEALAGITYANFDTFKPTGNLEPKPEVGESSDIFTVVAYWAPNVEDDNQFNVQIGATVSDYAVTNNNYLWLDIGVILDATQATVESDSFGSDYDADATTPWRGGMATAEELAAAKNEDARTLSITSPELLAAFVKDVDKGTSYGGYTVELKNNIDMNNLAWTPIGSAEHPFDGTFNGNGNSINGLSSELFSCVKDAAVKDLSITVNSTTGGLIADASGTNAITNVTVNGTIVGNADSKNAAFILETKEGSDTTMTKCINNANVTSNVESAAGYVGSAYGKLTFNGCVNNGNMVSTKATGAKATGYIVTVRPNAVVTFTDCENNGDVSVKGAADMYGAGFICWDGSNYAVVTITNCTNNGDITGERTGNGGSTIALGGIIGTCWNKHTTTLTNVTNNGKISAVNNATEHNAHVGGIVGMANPNAVVIIESATSNGALSCAVNNTVGSPNVGGLIGQINNATVTVNSATITKNVTVSATVASGSTKPLNVDALLGNVTGNTVSITVNSQSITNDSDVACRY